MPGRPGHRWLPGWVWRLPARRTGSSPSFTDGSPPIRAADNGEGMHIGEIDPHCHRNPGSAELHSQFGYALANRASDAIPHPERALQISPGLVEARYYLGAALRIEGQTAQALAQWRQALRQDPDNLRVLNDLAWVLATSADAALRNGAEAVTLAGHAVDLTSGHEPAPLATQAGNAPLAATLLSG